VAFGGSHLIRRGQPLNMISFERKTHYFS
jgi:hypothetical protein